MKPPECRILHHLPYSIGGPRRPQTPDLNFFASLCSAVSTYFFLLKVLKALSTCRLAINTEFLLAFHKYQTRIVEPWFRSDQTKD